ncbi:MAG TPA: kelch repeat-containing protein, partial [Polyangiaceae bacterium]
MRRVVAALSCTSLCLGCFGSSSSPSHDAGAGFDAATNDASFGDAGGGSDGGGGTESGSEAGHEASTGDGGGCPGGGGPGTWMCVGSMATPRVAPGIAALPGGKALVAGGWNATSKVLTSAELFDATTNTFSPTGSMTSEHLWGLWGTTWPTLGNGKVLAAGGLDSTGALVGVAELYDPAAGTFAATASLHTPVISMFPALLGDGSVLLVGGWNSTTGAPPTPGWMFFGSGTSEVQHYDPTAGTWADTGALAENRLTGCAVTLQSGHVLLLGGGTGQSTNEQNIESYDPTAGKWTSVGTLSTPSCVQAFLLPTGQILMLGDGSAAGSDLIDPTTFAVTPTTGFPSGWATPVYAQLSNGDVIGMGGT